MDFSLQQVIKKEKEDFEFAAVENPSPFYIEINVDKQQYYEEYDWSYNALKTSFEEMCSICGQMFKNRYLLLQHNITHLNITLEPLNIIIGSSEDNLDPVKKCKITETLHKCESCNKILSYKSWNAHIKEVHTHGYYKCTECDKIFQCKRYLRSHIRNVHKRTKSIDTKEVTCPICSIVSKNRATLYCHLRNIHSEKKYQCEKCGSKLKCYSYYLTHLRRVHYNDGMEHKCDLCHKKFKSPRYLSVHKKNSHGPNTSTKKIKVENIAEDVL